MRRTTAISLLASFLILALLIRSVFTLITLLFEDASHDAIHLSELPSPNSSLPDTAPQLIPKIIHQTYINESIPPQWQVAQQSCVNLHNHYEYKFWTDVKSREFIAAEYPWFLNTFDGYHYPIQRADAIRYFVLAHFGGVYIDLDYGCKRCLDPLLSYTAWVHLTEPTGISNDAMGAVPQHPFFLRVIENLQSYNRNWLFPYVTVMYSTGPLFLSVIWKEWMAENAGKPTDWNGRVRVLMVDEYSKRPWAFFDSYGGSSWHRNDARLILWMAEHWIMLTTVGFMAACVVGVCLSLVFRRTLFLGPHWKHHGRTTQTSGMRRLSLWRRAGAKEQYDLVDNHDA
jgi:inositol phosphorylceramide mannosyltransferase catalytic subunit